VEDVQILFTFSRKEDVVFSKQELKELAGFRSDASPVLSVYLNVDVTQLTAEQYRLTLRGMLKSVADKAAHEDIEAVERYLDLEYDWQGKGIAIFSATDFWRAYPLVFPVGNSVHVSPQPHIKPLADYFDAYDRYGVVLVDREGARLFLFNQGTLQDATGVLGEELRNHRRDATGRGGRSGTGPGQGKSPGLDGRLERVTTRNLRDAVELTQAFYKAGKCERIILGGTDDNRARFLAMLPKALQNEVIGGLPIDMYASATDVLERTMDIIQDSVAERKAALVQSLITAAHKDLGSLGLADTLLAVQEQRVQTLAISEGFCAAGYLCTHCGYLTLREGSECAMCEGPVQELEDVVDDLVHRAIGLEVEVVFVRDEALDKAGSIGALWRF
jgi:peptide subunit release factor 1 (eRF1)